MDEDAKQLQVELGKVIEATGRMLQRKSKLDLEDLTLLSETLTYSAEAVSMIVTTVALRHV